MKKRLANKVFIGAAAAFIYQVLQKYGVAPEAGLYQTGIDIISYILIGAGVYSSFNEKSGE
jgi:hypothetical protein